MDKKLLKSLLKPGSFDESTASVRLVQTHISYLFITDNFVYKIKKPVDLGFLNFTSLDRRRFYCNEEVRLNSRLCPDLYLGVVEIRESPSGCHVCGEGTIVEYAVKMKRLPEERMLHHLLDEDAVSVVDVRRIARRVADFHLAAERGGEIASYGSSESIRHNWEENFEQLLEFLNRTLDKADLRVVWEWLGRFMVDHEELFAKRVADGYIRDCDGDLHAENICLTDGVCIFDCIEFSSRYRYSDTAADIAFLLMDFDFHGKREFSDLFLKEYSALTEDEGAVALTDFYKVYRAMVRGKVESLRLNDPHISDEEKLAARVKAARYFKLARGYCLRGKLPPSLIITSGLMGSGKSSIAANLAFELGLTTISSDRVRKELSSLLPSERRNDAYGTGMYDEESDRATYRELLSRAEEVLRKGESIIVDATFRRRSDRLRFRNLADTLGVPLFMIHTVCPDKLARQRLLGRRHRTGEVSDGRIELFARQREEFEPILADEGSPLVVDTSRPIPESINEILKGMRLL